MAVIAEHISRSKQLFLVGTKKTPVRANRLFIHREKTLNRKNEKHKTKIRKK